MLCVVCHSLTLPSWASDVVSEWKTGWWEEYIQVRTQKRVSGLERQQRQGVAWCPRCAYGQHPFTGTALLSPNSVLWFSLLAIMQMTLIIVFLNFFSLFFFNELCSSYSPETPFPNFYLSLPSAALTGVTLHVRILIIALRTYNVFIYVLPKQNEQGEFSKAPKSLHTRLPLGTFCYV